MNAIAKDVYQKLVREIGEIYEGARRTLVEAYWKIGQRIVRVEQQGAVKAVYGSGLLQKISEELTRKCGPGFSESNLRRMRQFYLSYPIRAAPHELTWTQYSELLPVGNAAVRKRLEKQALREGLSHKAIRKLVQSERVREEAPSPSASPESRATSPDLLIPLRGKLHTHQIALKGGALYLDLGFRIYRPLTPDQAAAGFKEGDIVNVEPLQPTRLKRSESGSGALYTYEAALDHIYDGDTQWYFIFTGRGEGPGNKSAGFMKNDKLRLRGIDCPELKYAAGKAAKRFVVELFSRAVGMTVTTTKPDKYDRYLSDIFLRMKDGAELFLNNELLAAGHACLYSDPKPKDWED